MTQPGQMDLLDDGKPAAADTPAWAAIARRMPANVLLGTSSWSFPGWAGLVFDRCSDRSTLAREGLAAYARQPLLQTVCVDRSYYGELSAGTWRRYAEQVPAGFRFLVKAPWTATQPFVRATGRSNPQFLDPDPLGDAIASMQAGLGDKLAAVICQFPPSGALAATAFAERLHRCLTRLPRGPTIAVEIRTPAWLGPTYATVLADVGAVHCYTVHPRMPGISAQAARLTPRPPGPLVARWNLGHGQAYDSARERYAPFDRIVDPDPVNRAALATFVTEAADTGRAAFVAINNKAEGSAPLSVEALARAIIERGGG